MDLEQETTIQWASGGVTDIMGMIQKWWGRTWRKQDLENTAHTHTHTHTHTPLPQGEDLSCGQFCGHIYRKNSAWMLEKMEKRGEKVRKNNVDNVIAQRNFHSIVAKVELALGGRNQEAILSHPLSLYGLLLRAGSKLLA